MNESFIFQPVSASFAREFICWQYIAPYDVYIIVSHPTNEAAITQEVQYFLDPNVQCYVLTDQQGVLLAFCTFGKDGQVPGGDYSEDALDIGLGVHPDLTGQGHGHLFVRAVIAFAIETFQPQTLRVTIATFNHRAQRVWQQQGFVQGQQFTAVSWTKQPFIIMTRPVHSSTQNHA